MRKLLPLLFFIVLAWIPWNTTEGLFANLTTFQSHLGHGGFFELITPGHSGVNLGWTKLKSPDLMGTGAGYRLLVNSGAANDAAFASLDSVIVSCPGNQDI